MTPPQIAHWSSSNFKLTSLPMIACDCEWSQSRVSSEKKISAEKRWKAQNFYSILFVSKNWFKNFYFSSPNFPNRCPPRRRLRLRKKTTIFTEKKNDFCVGGIAKIFFEKILTSSWSPSFWHITCHFPLFILNTILKIPFFLTGHPNRRWPTALNAVEST